LTKGLAAVFCSLMMTIGGILVYCANGNADAIYWAAVAGLWTATLGFGAKAKGRQQRAAIEDRAGHAPQHDGSGSGGG
jgi:hypothetical protein